MAPFALSRGSSSSTATTDPTAVVSVNAPSPSAAAIEPCAQVLSALPVQLDGLNPRQVHPYPDEGAPAVGWGNPAIVFQCGVDRPKALTEGSSAFLVDVPNSGGNDVNWLPVAGSSATVFTVIDRSVYIQVTVPKSYSQPPLAALSTAIASVLPAICAVATDGTSTSTSPSVSTSTSASPPATPSPTTSPSGSLCVDRP